MKILVYAHRLEWGGTQVNAIELSATLRDRYGHDVAILATPGPMSESARQKGLRLLPAPDAHVHPSLGRMRALRRAVHEERPDVLHVWDWWQCLDALYSVYLPMRLPMVVTDMTMTVSRFLPMRVHTTFGTPALADRARGEGRRFVEVIVPPVDVHLNAPDAVDDSAFRVAHRITHDTVTLVTVSRLVKFMKSESLSRTIAAVAELGSKLPVRLIIVGDGDARADLQRQADAVNRDLARDAVVLVGPMLDPRPAYSAADVVIGMGGSALRAMAFAKPVLVVGEQNFCRPFNPQTADYFLYHGMYGNGNGGDGNELFVESISRLVEERTRYRELGTFARDFVLDHFSLEAVTERLDSVLESATARVPGVTDAWGDGLRTAAVHWGRHALPGALRQRLVRAAGGA
jgi:L-malate glycosyltransferase